MRMSTRNLVAVGPRITPVPPGFTSPDELVVGLVVVDKDSEMVAEVRQRDGRYAYVGRPTGLTWRVNFSRLRPATEREKRQLAAIGRLHAQR